MNGPSAEYQNEPLPEDEGDGDQLSAETIAAKTNGHHACVPIGPPLDDVRRCAGQDALSRRRRVADDFTGYVIMEPTPTSAFVHTLRNAKRSRSSRTSGRIIHAGLEKLTEDLLVRKLAT